jgi:hypothetical protein
LEIIDIIKAKAIPLLEKNIDEIDWKYLSMNQKAIPLLETNFDEIDWKQLSQNPMAMTLLEKNQDKINWGFFCCNTSANIVSILEKNMDKIKDDDWDGLSLDDMHENTIYFLEKNQDKIDWDFLSGNPNIFELDYFALKERCSIYKEELIQVALHPFRIQKYLDLGISFEELDNYI